MADGRDDWSSKGVADVAVLHKDVVTRIQLGPVTVSEERTDYPYFQGPD